LTKQNRKDRPGYQRRRRSDGTYAHYWNPARASSKAPKGLPIKPISGDLSDAAIAAQCRAWTDELLADLAGRTNAPGYDGTIKSLIAVYRTHEKSPYRELKHSTRIRDYDPSLRLISDTVGSRLIPALKGSDFTRWYESWGSKGRLRRAHGAIRKLRLVLSFGVQERLPGCAAAREILSLMRFSAPGPRTVKLEYEHAKSICDKALELERPSIALTQAIQWDTALRRIHIIGEWLPVQPGEEGGIVRGKTKWRGLTAADISSDLVLTVPVTSRNKKATRHDLTACPLVMEVLEKVKLPSVGPLIVSEKTKLPYRENYYAQDWREIAEAAGVPEHVWSMDARAGAISEAEAATGDLDAARKLAGHTTSKTTLGYVRNDDLENNRRVAEARSKLRQ